MGSNDESARNVEIDQQTTSEDLGVRFEVLGPLRALARIEGKQDRELDLAGPKQRLVLALLLARPNTTVSTDALIDELWGDTPPASARHTVQSYVSELRKQLGTVIDRDGHGYTVRTDLESLDSLEFEALTSAGQDTANSDPETASNLFREALDLWRGAPFQGLEETETLAIETRRLEELHLTAMENLFDTALSLGQHSDIVAELDRATNEHPYREQLRVQHMLALYRSGRQADALRAYQRTRVILAEDLGIEPSPPLRRLEEQILVQDPRLDLQARVSDGELGPIGPTHNPYKGLRSFAEADADDFFGRERLIDQMLELTSNESRLIAVVGPSGSGKSSVVNAGLVPAVRRSVTARGWIVATMMPGSDPFVELDAALRNSVPDPPATLYSQITANDAGLSRAHARDRPVRGAVHLGR